MLAHPVAAFAWLFWLPLPCEATFMHHSVACALNGPRFVLCPGTFCDHSHTLKDQTPKVALKPLIQLAVL
jgi:hypothetical protein